MAHGNNLLPRCFGVGFSKCKRKFIGRLTNYLYVFHDTVIENGITAKVL